MFSSFWGAAATLAFSLFSSTMPASGLGSTCTAPLGSGTAAPGAPYWQQSIAHQGSSPYGPSGYQVFRNVKDFGAKGDGVTDDTAAINSAISSGGRCGLGCTSFSTTPATVFFPSGTYLVSAPLIDYYYTEIVGDARVLPTLKAAASFVGMAVIDADPYIPGGGGAQWYVNQNNFYRSVRNIRIDLTAMPASASATGLHWQVSQATSLYNVVVDMSTAAGNNHQGIFMENGSGGFMGDLVFNGGKYGIWVGNQQFTVRNITVNNAATAIFGIWNWGWTWQGVTINNCQVGFDITTGTTSGSSQGVASEAIIDATVTNTPVFFRSSAASNGALDGSIVLNNIVLNNVPTAVGLTNGAVVLKGGTTTINTWVQGNVYSGTNPAGSFHQSTVTAINKPSVLLTSSGKIFGKGRPTYANFAPSQFVSVKSQGAKGDGKTDDTAALQAVFNQFAGCKIIYIDQGVYIVSSTLHIPAGVQIVGEAWPTIMGSGSAFSNPSSPQVVVQVGTTGSTGVAEISGVLFSTRASAGGAIVVEWNVHDPSGQQGAAGMWDTLIRLGGATGTNIQEAQCANTTANTGTNCFAAFLGLHLTAGSSAYLEGTWVWLADHDIDSSAQPMITAYSGRGIYSQSAGPVWMIGTASEHHVFYQYSLVGASNHYIGLAQTESPYFQPTPAPPSPFTPISSYNDPSFPSGLTQAWAMSISNSHNILIFGAGFYSFFQSYNQACDATPAGVCQSQVLDVDGSSTGIGVYGLNTVYVGGQVSVGGKAVVLASGNRNGLSSTVSVWTM
ncbi:exo-beta-1-3-glucanase [Stereum hirsutum FP-91666 SS1]|uniref:exo-beta-1-3-glucanase n=1 Tax=Stereum hirsutum (strain FP-91666) TaxID=721885 RepID=UPI0004449583|nr:exo-beta-1-3-glucanase [Stereum hirsutum FP-91666 SS1]EIM83048.1 exo-beta-1-3-glucanase [Stereum hirsutum FP-91666 SS1]